MAFGFTVDSNKLEYGFRVIFAGFPSFLGDSHSPTFWLLVEASFKETDGSISLGMLHFGLLGLTFRVSARRNSLLQQRAVFLRGSRYGVQRILGFGGGLLLKKGNRTVGAAMVTWLPILRSHYFL